MTRSARFGSAICAIVASAALIGAAGLNPAALAQQAKTAGIVTFSDLFVTTPRDSVDLQPGAAERLAAAARKAQAPGQCPLGRFTIFVAKGDPLFQEALGAARRDAVLAALNRQGIDASRFFVDFLMFGGEGGNDAQLDYDAGRDQTAPTLAVTWTPKKGTKVKAKQRITAKAVARDDADRWQTGINTIDLDVQGGGSFGFHDYPRPQPPCENPPPPRTLDGVYTVPADPPPIVRLRAVTKDFAGHDARDIAEFPTGDWYGRFGWTHICQGGGYRDETHGIADLTLDYDGRGNLTGTLTGSTPQRAQTMPPCTFTQVAPATFSAKLVGSYTPGRDMFSAQATNVQSRPGRASVSCPAGSSVGEHAIFEVYQGPIFKDAFRDLRRQPDDSRASTGESTFSSGGATCTTKYSLTLRQAQD